MKRTKSGAGDSVVPIMCAPEDGCAHSNIVAALGFAQDRQCFVDTLRIASAAGCQLDSVAAAAFDYVEAQCVFQEREAMAYGAARDTEVFCCFDERS
jgi:hypothetical protein